MPTSTILQSKIVIGFDIHGVLSHIKDILTNESNSNAYTAGIGQYFMHYIILMYSTSQKAGMKEMFEIRDAYKINLNSTKTSLS